MSKSPVSASVVREWAKANLDKIAEAGHTCLGENARGRLHPEVQAAYNRAHRNREYVVGTPDAGPSRTVNLMVETANGRKVPRRVNLTNDEVRSLTGHSAKGRIPNAVVQQAALAKIGK